MRVSAWFRRLVASAGVAVLALGAAALAVIVLGIALTIGGAAARDMERRTETAVAQAHETKLQGMALLQAITDAETAQRGYLLTGRSSYLQPYLGARERAETALGALEPSGGTASLLKARVDHRLTIIDGTIELARAGRRDQALPRLDGGREVMTELRDRLGDLVASAGEREAAIRAERRRLDQQAQVLQTGLGVLTVLALLIAIGSLVFERLTARRATLEQARLHEQLLTARNSAQEANDAKSRFLATASHDMRQPLHALALYISTLERRVESPQARDILGNMDGAVRAMTRLFAALLDLARLEAGSLKPELMDFPLGPLLREIAAQSVDPRTGAGIRLVTPSLEVHSDPDLLEVIVRNLASNAVKHSKGEVLLGCRRVGDFVRIEVHDNGQGIPEDQIQRLFSEFVRGQEAGSAEGIGLGLAIVERMAKLLDHQLSVRSETGRGSVFSITVPLARSQRGAAAPAAAPETAVTLEGIRILVADDEPLALDAMKHAFEDAGAQVTTARSAHEVRNLATQRFDLYTFDLNLGHDDGLRLLAELEQLKGEQLATLIVTGATMPEVLAQLRDAGRPWITKPIAAAALLSAASDALSAS